MQQAKPPVVTTVLLVRAAIKQKPLAFAMKYFASQNVKCCFAT